jgi:peptide/nickel transport system substrate-binding protein
MHRRVKRHCFVIAAVLLVAMLAGCGQTAAPPKPEAKPDTRGTLIFAERDEPVWLNPVLEKAGQDTRNNNLIYDCLFALDEKAQIVPRIGTKYTVSPDGKEYTVTLVKNAKWHDGKPVTADDVVFTYMAHMHPKVASRYKSEMWALVGYAQITDAKNPQPFGNFKPVEAVDPYTIKFKLSQPYSPFPTLVLATIMIVPKHLLEKDLEKMAESTFNQNPVGCGPFKFVSWKRDDSVIYDAFDDYYLGKPKLKRVVYRIIPDVTVQSLELQKGSVHGMGTTTIEMHRKFAADPNINAIIFPGRTYGTVAFVTNHPFWQDKRVRQAFAYGVDMAKAVREYLGEMGQLAWSPIPPAISWAHNPNLKPYAYDPAKAMKLLNEAGWKLDSKGVLRNAKGQAFEFELGTFVGVERASMNVIFQENLRKLGMIVHVATRASADQMYKMYEAKGPDMTFINWGMTLDPDPEMWRRLHSSEDYNNYYNWSNKRADELLDLARKEQDQAKRQKYYWELQEIIHEELPGLTVFWRQGSIAFRKNVKGYVLGAASSWLEFIHLVEVTP